MDTYSSMWIAFLIVTSLETALDADVASNVSAVWLEHVRLVDHFECKHPQKRAFKVVDLLDGQLIGSELVVPHRTVLHRCDAGTGCCQEAVKECKVAKAEDVELTFYVINHINKTKGFKVFTFTNHTLCSCQLSVDDIK